METNKDTKAAALSIRRNILTLAYNSHDNAHIAPALSIADIMSVLYFNSMRYDEYQKKYKDTFILSKGHGALAYYTALIEAGVMSMEEFCSKAGEKFPAHPFRVKEWGIDYPGGSLGMGLSYGCGLVMSNRLLNKDEKVFVLIGDGELNEGVVWESVFFAAHNKLDNLIAIVDRNSMQSDGFSKDILHMNVENIWQTCDWNVITCDGHDCEKLINVFNTPTDGRPMAIIAKTIKGKGISFMENNKDWHHNKLSEKQYIDALSELECAAC
jgi:transketolase